MNRYPRMVYMTCHKCGSHVIAQECADGHWYLNYHLDLLAFILHGENVKCEASCHRITLGWESVKAAIDDLIEDFKEIARG